MKKMLERKPSEILSRNFKTEDDEEVEENHPVDVDPLPHQIVLSFDHILEQIFSFLDTPNLLNCRLVSHRFLKLAHRPLEKQIIKRFWRLGPQQVCPRDCSGRTLAQLAEFLQQPASQSKPNLLSFPCTNFWFYGTQLGNDFLQKFLDINGQHMRTLTVDSSYKDGEQDAHENILMEQLCNILTIQAPHLQSLSLIGIEPKVEWLQGIPIEGSINPNSRSRSIYSPLLITDPEFQQISSRVESLLRKSSLRILNICGYGLAKTMECLFQLSPKLQKVNIKNDYYRHVVQPVSRVHLLKSLTFNPTLQVDAASHIDNHWTFDMGTMERISLDKNLRLRKLKISFDDALLVCKVNPEFENKVVLMINRILERCKDTLEVLNLRSFTFLRGMRMPSSMPNVRKIEILDFDQNEDSTFFPKGFSMTNTFPKLTDVELTYFPDFDNDDDHFSEFDHLYEFLSRLLDIGGDAESPVLSLGVKKVVVDLTRISWFFTKIPVFLHHRIQKRFPSASVEFMRP